MGHLNIYDPNLDKWACFSTSVNDYITHWLPKPEYQAWLAKDALSSVNIMDYEAIVRDKDFLTVRLDGNTCIITIKDVSKIKLKQSDWMSKDECDQTIAVMKARERGEVPDGKDD